MLGHCGDLLRTHGGHAFAAGLTVDRPHLPELRRRMEQLVRERLAPEDMIPRLTIDAEVRLADCDAGMIEWLERLSPHGLGNPEPTFVARGVRIDAAAAVGGGRHLRLALHDGTAGATAIGFGLGARARTMSRGSRCDLAFVPTPNEYMGETQVQLKVKDVRVS
jgi:single-stranded-DNA-specific exonuclease